MKKMVILTEGQTEQIFIAELFLQIASTSPLKIDSKRLWGGRRGDTYEIEVSTRSNTDDEPSYYILIIDCASDGRVVSALKERYDGFIRENFEIIMIVRDVRPDFTFDEIEKAKNGFAKQLPLSPVLPVIALAAMEIEAWFIRELSHFSRIHPTLTLDRLEDFGISEETEFEKIDLPAKKISEIYESVGASYGKSRAEVQHTVDILDKALYFSDLSAKIPNIGPVLRAASDFFERGVAVQTDRTTENSVIAKSESELNPLSQ